LRTKLKLWKSAETAHKERNMSLLQVRRTMGAKSKNLPAKKKSEQ